jgi:hypothetical protein
MWKYKQPGGSVLLALLLVFVPLKVSAQSSSSPNYRVDQTIFGTGGELDAQSNSFRSRQTAGELTIGQTDSASFRAFAGFNTTDEPYLEFVVTADNIDLGYLDTDETATANGLFYVRAWQASGYVVRTESEPPTNTAGSTNQINPLTTSAGSTAGTEQFGINLVENTCPTPSSTCANPFGADPEQSPDNTFSFGQVATNYATPNTYRYNKGEIIAFSNASTSTTIYTLSYIFNIDEATTAGDYVFNHVLVATGTY